MSGLAGRRALVKVTGDAVAFTAEATTASGNITYQITSATKRVWDRTAAITVKNSGVTVDPAVTPYTINRLTGTVTFLTSVVRVITIDGSYLPVSVAAGAKSYTWQLTATSVDDSDFDTADTESGFTTRVQMMREVSGSIGGNWNVDQYFATALLAGDPIVLEFYSSRDASPDLICWALLAKAGMQSALDKIAEVSVDFVGASDDDGRVVSDT